MKALALSRRRRLAHAIHSVMSTGSKHRKQQGQNEDRQQPSAAKALMMRSAPCGVSADYWWWIG